MKTSRETLGALLETTGFLNLHPDEKKRILFDLLPDLKVDGSNMARHLATWLKARPEMLAKHDITPDEDLLGMLASPATLEEAYDQAYEERRIARRELKIMGDSPRFGDTLRQGVPLGLTREQLETSLTRKREELSSLHVAIGETKGMAEGERRQIKRELESMAREYWNVWRQLLRDADPADLEARLTTGKKSAPCRRQRIRSPKGRLRPPSSERRGKLLAGRNRRKSRQSKRPSPATARCFPR